MSNGQKQDEIEAALAELGLLNEPPVDMEWLARAHRIARSRNVTKLVLQLYLEEALDTIRRVQLWVVDPTRLKNLPEKLDGDVTETPSTGAEGPT